MKRRFLAGCILILLLTSLPLNVSASSTGHRMVVDSAGLLSEQEQTLLEDKAITIRDTYQMDVVIVTVDSLNGSSPEQYADDYFDFGGYGYGENHSGVLFLLAMEERIWYISTSGDAFYAVTDYGIQQLGETAAWYLSDGDYYEAFYAYMDRLPAYFEAYHQGAPLDGYVEYTDDFIPGTREERVYYEEEYTPSLLLSVVIGVITAGVVILIMRSSMNTKRKQQNASGYLKTGSFRLKGHQDLFLYSNVSKVRRQQNNSSGGGSSVHRSSSGRRHGGGGDRF